LQEYDTRLQEPGIGDVFKALALNGLGFVLYGIVNIPGFPAEHVLA